MTTDMAHVGFALGMLAALWLAFSLGFVCGAWWRSLFDRATEEE